MPKTRKTKTHTFSLSCEKKKLGIVALAETKERRKRSKLSFSRAITRQIVVEELVFFNELQKRRRALVSAKALSLYTKLILIFFKFLLVLFFVVCVFLRIVCSISNSR